jgi:putative photosynthetic complex assembly protein 2
MPLASIGSAVLYTVFLWWFSTGAILWLDRLPRSTYRWSLLGASLATMAAIYGLISSLHVTTPAGAICAFSCALGLWGWHELSFLTGFIAGPRREPCPPGATGRRRFVLATATVIHHELALVATAVALTLAALGQPNQIGCWTFDILLAARLSAKLNLFLGVPNFSDAFFPDHLRYLTSYLRKGPISPLFPLSIVGGAAVLVATGRALMAPEAGAFEATGYSLIAALTALALIEHGFMVVPLPDTALWRWAMPASAKGNNA